MCNCNNNIVISNNRQTSRVKNVVEKKIACEEEQCGFRQSDIIEMSRMSSLKYRQTRNREFLEINNFYSTLMTSMYNNCTSICDNIDKINENAKKLFG